MNVKTRLTDILRVAGFITASTIILTANFIGVIAAFSNELRGIGTRVQWYVVAASLVFVVTIITLERSGVDGKSIIITAPVVGGVSFVLILFGVEGVRFGLENPDSVFFSTLILYFIAAALIATGLGYWGIRHWREFIEQDVDAL